MNTGEIARSLHTLFSELVDGAPMTGAYILNRGDAGLLRSLDRLSAAAASATTQSGSSIAAHTDHVRYGLSLMNRWSSGENPFEDADWTASWRRTSVSEAEWAELRANLDKEAHRWLETLGLAREMEEADLNAVVGSIAHLAYHVGAIRQIDGAARGPTAND